MAHIHSVYDTDSHFSINPITRQFKNEGSAKAKVSQFDHNSERFTFEIPRYIADGHDMSLCNSVQVHFLNVNPQTKEKRDGFYVVDDLQISPEDENVVICSWLIAKSATQLEGKLNFLIRFSCVADDGTVEFVWNTAIYTDIAVSSGIYNGDADDEEYIDILKQWEIGFNNRLDAVVSYEAQDVTDEQKEQARENIGAASKEDLESLDFMPPDGNPEAEVRFDVAHAQMMTAPEFVIADPESSAGSILLTKEGAEEDEEPRKAVMLTDPSGNPVVMSNVADPEKETDVANKKFVREQVGELSKYLEDLVHNETIQVYGAKVGQLLKVEAVDENGHPTAWETVSMGQYDTEKIFDHTFTEDDAASIIFFKEIDYSKYKYVTVYITQMGQDAVHVGTHNHSGGGYNISGGSINNWASVFVVPMKNQSMMLYGTGFSGYFHHGNVTNFGLYKDAPPIGIKIYKNKAWKAGDTIQCWGVLR